MKFEESSPIIFAILITFVLTNLVNWFLNLSFRFKFIGYIVIFFIIYWALINLENYYWFKRTKIPLTQVRFYGKFNKYKTRGFLEKISGKLIKLGYYDIDLLEGRLSKGDKWIILASKINDKRKKRKIFRDHSSNIRPKIILNKGNFSLKFLKFHGEFVKKESQLLYDSLKKIRGLKLNDLIK